MNRRGPSRQSTKGQAVTRDVLRSIVISDDTSGNSGGGRGHHAAGPSRPVNGVRGSPIDVEASDDDVEMVSSSRVFPQSRNQTRRQQPVTVDLEEEDEVEVVNQNNQRKKAVNSSPEPGKVIMKEPTFTCPICMNSLVDASSTICGHVFCGSCIKVAIQASKKCPICARKLKISNFHRVYLPATTE